MKNKTGIKRNGRKQSDLTLSRVRSAITNGSTLLSGVDARTGFMRRLRDLVAAHESDAGGRDILSEGQRAIIRRASMIGLQLEMMEAKFALNEGAASSKELESYQRASNSLRRLLEALGLLAGRKARNVTPSLGALIDEARRRPAAL
jgi:hypothetical protein